MNLLKSLFEAQHWRSARTVPRGYRAERTVQKVHGKFFPFFTVWVKFLRWPRIIVLPFTMEEQKEFMFLRKWLRVAAVEPGVTKYDYLPRVEKSEKNGLVLMHFKFKLLLGLPQFSSVNMTWNKWQGTLQFCFCKQRWNLVQGKQNTCIFVCFPSRNSWFLSLLSATFLKMLWDP